MSSTSQKTPEALTASARAAQLAKEGRGPVHQSVHERRASIALTANATVNAAKQIRPDDDLDGASFPLSPKDVYPYDRNPRRRPNPAYAEIKTSIRARGFEGTLLVTKRPGDNRYMLAAGGNTSLAIIQELLEETPDDPRWRSVEVRYKKWPGEPAVLAAHLAENDARSETTFWDKACGVANLKAELEKALGGRLLGAAELTKEAERMGAKYGVRSVQYFLFAVEHLAPVGPWVTLSAVKDTLSPAVQSLRGLSEVFGIPAEEFRGKMVEVLELCATVMRDREAQSPTGQAELDVRDVLNALNEAAAQLISVDTRQLAQMLSVRATHPRMTAAQLRDATKATHKGPPIAPPSSGPTAPAPEAARGASSDAPQEGLTAVEPAPTQLPLGGMLAAVVARPTSQEAVEDSAQTALEPTDPRNAPGTINAVLMDIVVASELGDVVWQCDEMPLGYFVELPEAGVEARMDGLPVKNPSLRKAAWHLLAALSGQYDRRLVGRLPDDCRWKQLLVDGGFASQFELQVQGHIRAGECYLPVEDVHQFLWHPQLGHLFLQLWSWALHWRGAEPARFPSLDPVKVEV